MGVLRDFSGVSDSSLSQVVCGASTTCCMSCTPGMLTIFGAVPGALGVPRAGAATGGDGTLAFATGGEGTPFSGIGSAARCWSASIMRLPRKMLTKLLMASLFFPSGCGGDRGIARLPFAPPSAGMALRLPCWRMALPTTGCEVLPLTTTGSCNFRPPLREARVTPSRPLRAELPCAVPDVDWPGKGAGGVEITR